MKVGRYPSNTVFNRKVISVCEAWSSPTYLAEVVASRKVTLRDRNPWSTCSSSLKNRASNSLSATKRYHWGIGLRTEDLTLMEPEAWSWDKCHPRNADMAATWTFRVDVVSPLSRPSYRNSQHLTMWRITSINYSVQAPGQEDFPGPCINLICGPWPWLWQCSQDCIRKSSKL